MSPPAPTPAGAAEGEAGGGAKLEGGGAVCWCPSARHRGGVRGQPRGRGLAPVASDAPELGVASVLWSVSPWPTCPACPACPTCPACPACPRPALRSVLPPRQCPGPQPPRLLPPSKREVLTDARGSAGAAPEHLHVTAGSLCCRHGDPGPRGAGIGF